MQEGDHVEILKRGTFEWDRWRWEHPDIKPILCMAQLQKMDLEGAYLDESDLMGAAMDGANLQNALLRRANLSTFEYWPDDWEFPAYFSTSLSEADLRQAALNDSDLSYACLVNADLTGVDLTGAKLAHADLRGAKLTQATLDNADLTSANLSGAYLNSASLLYTRLTRAAVNGATFELARMGLTVFGDNDLSSVKGLDTIEHVTSSVIGINTFYLSAGHIPELFLRNAGVANNFIESIPSLNTESANFYSCFISFTESDDEFSERIYDDLRLSGVRCWRWKEDAKWGRTLMRSIDEALHHYDRLVVICSEQSLNSPGVLREIERALQKEDELIRSKKMGEVLFPIRLDDYIFDRWQHHRRADVVAKHVGDFRLWREKEYYDKAIKRLLHDLNAS